MVTYSAHDPHKSTTNASPSDYVDPRKRNFGSEASKQPKKRQHVGNRGISDDQRQQTMQSILQLLKPLTPPENTSDLLHRTAKRLEENLFNKLLRDRPVNALGRSSTLLTAVREQNVMEKYLKEKDMLLEKVGK